MGRLTRGNEVRPLERLELERCAEDRRLRYMSATDPAMRVGTG
jgi:hypothetical protein